LFCQEYQKRFEIFRENMKKVQFLKETERGTGKYGASPFADLTEAEFRKEKLGLLKPKPMSELPSAEIPEVNLPAEFDWRHFNAVTPVKNQGRTLLTTNHNAS
jgi:cathepsin F